MPSVLIVDDLLSIHEMLDAVIQPTGFSTAFATDGEKALARYKAEKFDLVLADIDMKPMDGITLLKQIKVYDPNCVLVIMTAYASTESAIQALKYGAFDYLQKPFRVDELISTLKRGIEYRQFQAERQSQASASGAKGSEIEGHLIGSGPEIKKIVQQIKKLSSVRTPVLLQGERGTGKSTVAEVLHANSNPPEAPFVRVDCALSNEASLRAGLLGAAGNGGEWIEKAASGTLFLEQVHCLPLSLQKELVSVLRNAAHPFRLVCSTTEDLERMADEGRFHDELFFRIASLPVQLPPLRERIKDLPLLVKHFAASASNPLFDVSLVEFTEDALSVMSAYHWPGNLTELAQLVSQIASTSETRVITSQQLPLRLRELRHWPTLADYLAGQKKQYIERVLHACQGDREKAASVLGVEISKLS